MDPAPLLGDLIRAARDGPEAVLARVEEALAPLGFEAQRTRSAPTALRFTRGDTRLVLSGHVDVVPAGSGWTRDPFWGEVDEGRVWGRGACDMLGSVACFVAAAARAGDAPCAILLTTDEETRMDAARRALDEGLLRQGESVVVGEPTAMDVGIAEKGVLWLRVEAQGRNAHGSMPHLGDNAVARIARVIGRLEDLRPPGEHALLGRTTLSVNRVGGGEAVNQVPAEAFAEVDVRYLPALVESDALALVEQALAPEGGRARAAVVSSHAPFEAEVDAPLVRAALEAARASRPASRASGLPYGTEASKFAPAGFPTVILGPGEPGLAHTARESIALDDLEAGTACYARLLRAFAERGA